MGEQSIEDQTIEDAVQDFFRHRSWEGESLSVPSFGDIGLFVREGDDFESMLRLVGELATEQHANLHIAYFKEGDRQRRELFDDKIEPYEGLFETVKHLPFELHHGRTFLDKNSIDLAVGTLNLFGESLSSAEQFHNRATTLLSGQDAQLFAVPDGEARNYDALRRVGAGALLNFSALETFLPNFGQLLRNDTTLPLFTYMPEEELLGYVQEDYEGDDKQIEYFRSKTFEQVENGLEEQIHHFGRPLRDQDIFIEHKLLTESEELVDELKQFLEPDPGIFGFALPAKTQPDVLEPIFSAIVPAPLLIDVREEAEGGWASRLLS